jgi:CHASE2 domain-containing sensor protein
MTAFILDVQRIEQTCLLTLSWQQNRFCRTRILYPETLTAFYQEWSTSYLEYYRSVRARPGMNLGLPEMTIDWRSRLINAEADLLSEFQDWLRGRELYQMRQILAQAARSQIVQLYVQCDDMGLAKLPWEAWQIEAEFKDQSTIQILRTAPEIIHPPVVPMGRSRPRILAILGDDTGLDFQAERDAIQTQLRGVAQVQFEGWGISPPGEDLRLRLCQVITEGWDILFFAGHSNETGSGELMIAPDTSLFVHELEDAIQTAKSKGLRCAIFNSCKGLKIANALVNWGISHVVVMREPIHNAVAQKFFERFAQQLGKGEDICAATYSACEFLFLNAKKNFQYPSAFLIPSIYAYPGLEPYQLPRLKWGQCLNGLRPQWKDALLLGAIALLSFQPTVSNTLIDYRQAVQAAFPQRSSPPPVLLVEIDEESLYAAQIRQKDPIDRRYLAQVMGHAIALKAPTIGLDYVLKDDRPEQTDLIQTLRRNTHSQIVFAASSDPELGKPLPIFAPQRLGDIDLNIHPNRRKESPVFLSRLQGDLSELVDVLPFAHQIACPASGCEGRASMQPINHLMAWLRQTWLNPWIDYSVPPEQVYTAVSSADFLKMQTIQSPIVLIAPGQSFDAYISPKALVHRTDKPDWKMSGGAVHAYMIQNLLQQRLVVPVPDIWMIGIIGGISKLILHNRRKTSCSTIKRIAFIVAPLLYIVISLGIYQYAAISFPIVLPVFVYCIYAAATGFRRA